MAKQAITKLVTFEAEAPLKRGDYVEFTTTVTGFVKAITATGLVIVDVDATKYTTASKNLKRKC